MDEIIDQLEKMHIHETVVVVPKVRTISKQTLWKALHHVHDENKQLKRYIAYLLQHTHIDLESIPEWVY